MENIQEKFKTEDVTLSINGRSIEGTVDGKIVFSDTLENVFGDKDPRVNNYLNFINNTTK